VSVASLFQCFLGRWHIHWMRFHHQTGANVYTQCRCGKRSWYPLRGGYSALDRRWLDSPNVEAHQPEGSGGEVGSQ